MEGRCQKYHYAELDELPFVNKSVSCKQNRCREILSYSVEATAPATGEYIHHYNEEEVVCIFCKGKYKQEDGY